MASDSLRNSRGGSGSESWGGALDQRPEFPFRNLPVIGRVNILNQVPRHHNTLAPAREDPLTRQPSFARPPGKLTGVVIGSRKVLGACHFVFRPEHVHAIASLEAHRAEDRE